MSRSIHNTRRELIHEARYDYADSQQKTERLQALYHKRARKRRIKEQVKAERRGPTEALPFIAPESIPLRILDKGDYIHYPGSPTDLLAIMQRLPAGMLDGLTSIDLCLGLSEQTQVGDSSEPPLDSDPFTGRCGYEELPGVFVGNSRGVYRPDRSDIRLFAYVYDPALSDREMWESYMRLHMLATFVHEVAHHYDLTQRVARGRWLADQKEKVEGYAESTAYDLVQRHVVPYLELTYSESVKALRRWMRQYGGAPVPLSLLARNPNKLRDDIFGLHSALETLAFDVAEGKTLAETRLSFGRRLLIAERYKAALTAMERSLAEGENNAEALALKADIHGRLGQLDIALSLAQEVLALDGDFPDAWMVVANVYDARQEWSHLLTATTRILELLEPGHNRRKIPLAQRAMARLQRGDFEGCQIDIEELSQFKAAWIPKAIDELRKEMQSRFAQADGP